MAKRMPADDRGRVKFRVIEFELDGSDSALQDAIKGLANAISERGRVSTQHRLTTGDAKAASTTVIDEPIMTDGQDGIVEDEEAETETAPKTRAPRGTGKPRAVARPKIIDLDFTTGAEPLKKFLEGLNPENDTRRYLAIAYWLKNYRDIKSIGMDHAYTAYRAMGWTVPDDPLQPFRNMKTQGWFDKGTKRGEYTLNHIGEGKVGAGSTK